MRIAVPAGATTYGSIAGGFVRIDVAELAHAWEACRARPLGIGDFRAWLAVRELVARRAAGAEVRSPNYGIAELANLLDVTQRTAATAVRHLEAAGLLAWSESTITFPAPAPRGRLHAELADTIGRGEGTVSIPRRILRFLAKGASTALIATALAALLRCLSRRHAGFGARGRFKASWVSSLFGIAVRHARAARARLIAIGLLEALPGDQWALNRWGRAFLIRLDWAGPVGDRHPSPAPDGQQSSPPDLYPDPLREKAHPEPAQSGPAGTSLKTRTTVPKSIPDPASIQPAKPLLPAPNLRDIRIEDLADTGRVLELHRQAVERGRITASEADRVRFVAAVEHAKGVGKENPPGLLTRIVTKGWWHLLTQGDEDRASRRLREYQRPAATPRTPWRSYAATAPHSPQPHPQSPRPSTGLDGPARRPSVLSDILARLVAGPSLRDDG